MSSCALKTASEFGTDLKIMWYKVKNLSASEVLGTGQKHPSNLKPNNNELGGCQHHDTAQTSRPLNSDHDKIESDMMTNDEVEITNHSISKNSKATFPLRTWLPVTIIYLTLIGNDVRVQCNFVHSWSNGSNDSNGSTRPNGPTNYDSSLSSPLELIESSGTKHQHQKRHILFEDSFAIDNGSLELEFGQPTNQNDWLSLVGNVFDNYRSKATKPPRDSLDAHIRNILIPRVSGTRGNIEVRNYIVDFLRGINYQVTLDVFSDPTPVGDVEFANIIATSDPDSCRQLAIACHYDSKLMNGFLGAIDSAVPCSMMLELAHSFKDAFRSNNQSDSKEQSLGLMFIFFDGEEPFDEWTGTDSLYGSRHLAAKWEEQPAPQHCPGLENELKRLELLMILDLIGTSDTSFTMYSWPLSRHYYSLQMYEAEYIKDMSHIHGYQAGQATFKNNYFPLEPMQDDHLPFYKRDVPVLSLLSLPFPSVWHTTGDNYDAIDFPKTKQILYSIEKFVFNYRY